MTHDTVLFYARQIKKFCTDQDHEEKGCQGCPFYINDDRQCQFWYNSYPEIWDIPGEEEEDDN